MDGRGASGSGTARSSADGWGADGWAVRPGHGERVEHDFSWLEVLLRGQDVDGAMGAFVFTHPEIPENPPHAHLGFMKIAFVLEGDYEFRVGGASFAAGPGTLVVVPRGAHHTFTTRTGGRMLFVCSPSGNEEMFLEMGRLGPGATPEQTDAVKARFHTVGLAGEAGAPWRPGS
jgi:quercetin dioxygenase-like cupin family protein